MTFLSQSTTKIYVSFHTHAPCFCLNGAKSPVFDQVLAACLTLATTCCGVALSCPAATAATKGATARTTRILPCFIPVLLSRPRPTSPGSSRTCRMFPGRRARLLSRLHRSSVCAAGDPQEIARNDPLLSSFVLVQVSAVHDDE